MNEIYEDAVGCGCLSLILGVVVLLELAVPILALTATVLLIHHCAGG